MDEFAFTLTREEFLEFVFDGLELPHLERTPLVDVEEVRPVRAGVSRDGVPARINKFRFWSTLTKALSGATGARMSDISLAPMYCRGTMMLV